ncbi:putative PEP-binding protein, partial [Mobiluncus sp.]|uniref:putative PEP-binding protein n=1 Tax=Mobiluncus sp. TaxID=47293 RepID=UPI002A91CFFE
VGRDLAPADAANLPHTQAVAIVTELGGPTSHTALLARGIGIPAVVGAADILDVPEGTRILVDGTTGEIIINPTDALAVGAITAPVKVTSLTKPGATKDNRHIELLANIGTPTDAAAAAEAGAEGIGLFRTEFAYLGRDTEPTVTEQAESYRQVMSAFTQTGTAPQTGAATVEPIDPAAAKTSPHVVIRTLDAGSDKLLKFLNLPAEDNPALGVRGYRTAKIHPDVLKRQLEAIAAGAPDAWVMAPMIATPEEADAFATLARVSYGLKTVGVMVETPAAALMAPELYDIVDFVSIGTNDLTQYTFAADRLEAELQELQDPGRPALLRLIKAIGDAATRANKPLGVCGEAARNPELAPILVGLGVTSLSMAPRALAGVADALSALTFTDCAARASARL